MATYEDDIDFIDKKIAQISPNSMVASKYFDELIRHLKELYEHLIAIKD